jgi:hypothetical protein
LLPTVVLEQRPQALGEHRREAGRQEVPEQPVVDEHELGALLHGSLDQRALGRDARHDPRHLAASGHLQAVRTEVLELTGSQPFVQRVDDRRESRHRNGNIGSVGRIGRCCSTER